MFVMDGDMYSTVYLGTSNPRRIGGKRKDDSLHDDTDLTSHRTSHIQPERMLLGRF